MADGDVRREAERTVREARRTAWVRGMARSGFVASGVLRVLIGVLALLLASRAPGPHPDATGAFGSIARVPGGVLLLVVFAAGEWALAAWLVVAGLVHRGPRALERWRQRSVYWGRAVVYLVIGTVALRFALGARSDSGRNDREASRHLLDVPGGAVVLGLIGAAVVITGVGMVWIGAFLRFRRTLHLPRLRGRRRALEALGVVGYVVQGATIAAVGVSLVVAACTLDPARAGGLDGTLGAFAAHPVGRVALVVVGVGWVAAGVYAWFRAVLARLG